MQALKRVFKQTPWLAAGWALVAVTAAVVFIPSTATWLVVTKAVLLLAMAVFVWFGVRGGLLMKKVRLKVSGVEASARESQEKKVRNALTDQMVVVNSRFKSNELELELQTRATLASIQRRLKRVLPKGVEVEGTMTYALSNAKAGLEVEVTGHAAADAHVFIPGLEEPVSADQHGRFETKVPYEVIREHVKKGYIPARWEKGETSKKLQIEIPSA